MEKEVENEMSRKQRLCNVYSITCMLFFSSNFMYKKPHIFLHSFSFYIFLLVILFKLSCNIHSTNMYFQNRKYTNWRKHWFIGSGLSGWVQYHFISIIVIYFVNNKNIELFHGVLHVSAIFRPFNGGGNISANVRWCWD